MRDAFRETVAVPAPVDAVWPLVDDVPAVLSWITIVGAVEELEPGARYGAVLEDRLGPFRLRADLRIAVRERVAGELLRATAEGEDRQIGSRLRIEVVLRVRDDRGATAVDVEGSYEVTGRPATLGAGSIRKKAQKVLAEFFAGLERRLVTA